MKTAYIVDIDGILADSEIRDKFEKEISEGDYRWFEDRIPYFKSFKWAVEMVKALSRDHTILFITARDEKYRELTIKWLHHHTETHNFKLIMRHRDGCDAEIKRELYETKVKGKYNVLAAFDDRRKCIDLWRSFGITALYNMGEEDD